MPTYQLCLDRPLARLLDELAAAAALVAPGLKTAGARQVAELLLRARVRQTTSCGREEACLMVEQGVFRGAPDTWEPGTVRPTALSSADARDLPFMFAVAAADLAGPPASHRDSVEQSLARVFRDIVGPLLRYSNQCGRSPVCRADETDPFVPVK